MVRAGPNERLGRLRRSEAAEKGPKGETVIDSKFDMLVRAGLEYELRVALRLTFGHEAFVEKTRYSSLEGQSFRHPGQKLGGIFAQCCRSGEGPEPVNTGLKATQVIKRIEKLQGELSRRIAPDALPRVLAYLRKTAIKGQILGPDQDLSHLSLEPCEAIVHRMDAFLAKVLAAPLPEGAQPVAA